MKIRLLATLAVLAAVPAGILTYATITPAGTQNIAQVRVLDFVAANKTVPAKAHCVTMGMNHGQPTTLKCEGGSVSTVSAATAAAQVTKFSNGHFGAAPASADRVKCVLIRVIVALNGVKYIYYCYESPPGGGYS
jgi:hypothetical protein